MATFLSNQSLLASCPCSTPFSSKPFQTLKPKIISFPSRDFPRPLNSSFNRRTPLKYSQDSPPTVRSHSFKSFNFSFFASISDSLYIYIESSMFHFCLLVLLMLSLFHYRLQEGIIVQTKINK